MIVINARFLTQKLTGVQRFAIELCKRLPQEVNGKKIIFVAPNCDLNLENTFEIVKFGCFKGHLWEQIDLPWFLKRNGNPLLINFVGIGPLIVRNKIMFLYDLAFKHHPEWFSFWFNKVYNFFIPISLINSKLIITDSNYVKEDIKKTYNIDEVSISTIYAAHSLKFKRENTINKQKVVLAVSSIDPRKNLLRTIEAFKIINTDYKLIIVGSSHKSFSKVDLDVEKLKSHNIFFTGYISDEKLVELYNSAEVFVYPSLFEGFGIPPLEAQACGTPCIVSNKTSLPEVYGDSVIYCNPESVDSIATSIEYLLRNREVRKKLQEKGLENTKKYSWDNSSLELVNILNNIDRK